MAKRLSNRYSDVAIHAHEQQHPEQHRRSGSGVRARVTLKMAGNEYYVVIAEKTGIHRRPNTMDPRQH